MWTRTSGAGTDDIAVEDGREMKVPIGGGTQTALASGLDRPIRLSRRASQSAPRASTPARAEAPGRVRSCLAEPRPIMTPETRSSAVWAAIAAGGLLAMVGMAGCGDHAATPSPDAGTAAPSTMLLDLPTVVSYGGPVLVAPRVQAIYLPGFAFESEVDTFLASLQTSIYWPAVVAEYGVGPLSVLPSHVSSVSAPPTIAISDSQLGGIDNLFAQLMTADAAVLGAPSGDTIYALFFPPTTTFTSSGVAFCLPTSLHGFHFESAASGTRLAVVVIPSCTNFPGGPGTPDLIGFSALTPAISHELVEAATDPFLDSAPAFADTDAAHAMWSIEIGGGKVGDLCANEAPNRVIPSDIGFPVQRMWSNAAVQAGTGPCVPVPPGELFFVGVPDLPDRVVVQQRHGMTVTVPALSAAVGAAATVGVTFRSPGDMRNAWRVAAVEDHDRGATLSKVFSLTTGIQGQRLQIGVTPTEVSAGIFPLVVISANRDAFHLWIGAIQRQ